MAADAASKPKVCAQLSLGDAQRPLPFSEIGKLTSDDARSKQPCCVCKDEKSTRDECMLFSKAADPVADCKSTIERYRTCMAGFGFQV